MGSKGYLSTCLGFAVVATAACGRGGASEAREARVAAVKVAHVELVQIRREVEAVGTLAAQDETIVSAEVEARVARVIADLGDRVAAGAPLVALDAEKLQYRLDEQRAALDQARARYGAAAEGDLPPVERTPEVMSAAAQLAEAEQQLVRARELAARSLLPREQLEQADTKTQTARADHERALAAARQLRADITARTSSLRLAEREVQDATIRAPFDGYVAERLVAVGQFVRPETPVMRLVRVHPLRIGAEIPERFGPWIRVGQGLSVRVDAYPDRPFEGRLTRISPAVNLKTRAFMVEGEVPNDAGALKPGTFARVRIVTDRVDKTLVVPAAAVQNRYGTNRVFAVRDGKAVGAEVKVGDRLGTNVEILSGLDANTPIVAENAERIVDGMRVAAEEKGQ
jgi:multidrug efflux pump subunit AcrA (membrane-fusion protein)